MKILESSPKRYDRGIALLTMGKIGPAYDRIAANISGGMRVLDIGCGTGLLTIRAAEKGATVKGIDINPEMLEIAEERIKSKEAEKLKGNVEFCEMGTAELDAEKENSYDAVMSGLCFSELSPDEIRFTLKQLRRILKPGGLLLVADETMPENIFKRLLYRMMRIPLLLITYILTGTITRALTGFPAEVKAAGFTAENIRTNKLGNFMELTARNQKG